jgi:hypothetical protein
MTQIEFDAFDDTETINVENPSKLNMAPSVVVSPNAARKVIRRSRSRSRRRAATPRRAPQFPFPHVSLW